MIRFSCAISGFVLFLGPLAIGATGPVWQQEVGFRMAEVHPEPGTKPGFTLMDPRNTGVWFTNTLVGDAYATNAVAHNGAGVALGDVDGDGWPDIYLCNLQGPNRLYRNLGQWRFEEMELGEAACLGQFSTAAAFADMDGDGDLDLLVNGIGVGTRLFLNDGKGRFTELKDSGLSHTASPTSMALADIDGDGDLDLYCTHYIDQMHLLDPTTRFSVIKRDGRWVVLKVNDEPTTSPRLKDRFEALPDGRVRELPEVHGFYRNDGKGHFTAIQAEPGIFQDEEGKPIPPFRDWGLSAMFRDLNGDGAPDLYVCNDNLSPDRIWINSGTGKFRLIQPLNFRHTSRSSMGMDVGDVDRDGYDDIIVVDMFARDHARRMTQLVKDLPDMLEQERLDSRPQYNRNMLFFGRADGTFYEAALRAGVPATDWSWCPVLLDVDLDGYEDLLVTTGFETDVMDQDRKDELRNPQKRFTKNELRRPMEFYSRWHTAKVAYRNRHDGTFQPVSHEWGFDQVGVSHGMALADLDNDGDLDLVVNNLNGVASLYQNNGSASRIAVRLKGVPPNTQGIGARLKLTGPSLVQRQEMICGGRYLSCDQAMRAFAADPDTNGVMQLEVLWRGGNVSVISNLLANHIYEVDETAAKPPALQRVKQGDPKPYFREVSSLLNHVHHEDDFDDWAQQPSLPRRLSRLGPGVCWFDVDGDGWEDLILASGKGGKLSVYHNENGKGFRALEGTPTTPGDQGTVLGWVDKSGNRRLIVGMSNQELPPGAESEIQVFGLQNLSEMERWPAGKSSIGPLALADVDNDGDLDLFVGGRFVPGRYPEPASSSIWMNEGTLKPSHPSNSPFASLGLVTGATFADLDGDGQPDLALSLEWGSVRVFRNEYGQFEDMTSAWGLAEQTGWWTCITAGDFDGDGRLDLAVGNWGRNSLYELNNGPAQGIFYGEWNSDGRIAMIEAWQDGKNWFPVHNRNWLASTIPEFASQFPTHQAYGQATVRDILKGHYETSKKLVANELRSGVFLNRGSHFEWVPLPREAQISPVFSIQVADFNGDGVEDLFLTQNNFSAIPENSGAESFSRDDAGRGLWLQGVGDGTFHAVNAEATGIKVYGEQRGAAIADFDHDGRVDLVVSQNRNATRLYLNQGAKTGLRVTLRGKPANPEAIGAQLRVLYPGGGSGPCRNVSAGAGHWSQDGSTQVMGCAQPPVALWIRWPGGRTQTVPLRPEERSVQVNLGNEKE